MARILDRHPRLYAPGETHFFEEIWPGREPEVRDARSGGLMHAASRLYYALGNHRFEASQQKIQESFTIDDLLDKAQCLGGGYRGLYAAFAHMLAVSDGADRIVDDTPRHLFHIHAIKAMFPGAKILGMVRDPRDFLASYKNLWKITDAAEMDRIRSLYHPVVTSYYWRSSIHTLLRHVHHCCRENIHLVRYEDLVQEPEKVVRVLCDFIGVDYTADLLAVDNENSSFENAGSGIYSSSMGRWRTALEPHEQWIVQNVNHSNMPRLHYLLETVPFPVFSVFAAYLVAPFALMRTFWTNRARRGLLPAYLARRIRGMLTRVG
jgi:hypothetical protein